jgi:hypothetical protein
MLRPTLALAFFSTLTATAPFAVAQGRHDFVFDQATSSISYSGTVTAGGISTTLTGLPPTVQVTGGIRATVASDPTGSIITEGRFFYDDEQTLDFPTLVASIDNPVPGGPSIGNMIGTNIRIRFRSTTFTGAPTAFTVSPGGTFSTFLVSEAVSGTITITGAINTTVDITGFVSTPQAVNGVLQPSANGFSLSTTFATALGLNIPGLTANVPVTGSLTADDTGFAADVDGFPATAGGTQTMTVSTGLPGSGEGYVVLASVSGTAPGVALPGGFQFPLNLDGFTDASFFGANVFPWGNNFGNLDALGRADVTFSLPPLPAVLSGFEVNHAPLVLDAMGNVLQAGPAVTVTLQ